MITYANHRDTEGTEATQSLSSGNPPKKSSVRFSVFSVSLWLAYVN